MQPMLNYLDAEAILMDRLARQAPNAHQKVINSIGSLLVLAQATRLMQQRSVKHLTKRLAKRK